MAKRKNPGGNSSAYASSFFLLWCFEAPFAPWTSMNTLHALHPVLIPSWLALIWISGAGTCRITSGEAGTRPQVPMESCRSSWNPEAKPVPALYGGAEWRNVWQQVFSLHCVVAWQWEVEKIVRVDTLAWQRLPLQDLHAVALRPLFTKHATERRLAAAFELRSTMKHVLFSYNNDLQPTGNLFWGEQTMMESADSLTHTFIVVQVCEHPQLIHHCPCPSPSIPQGSPISLLT